MAIKREYTPVKALGRLAIRAGEAQAAEKARQIARQNLRVKLQLEQEQRKIELTAQIDLETFKRSKLWELEKMEIRSRSEFALKEKQWLQKEEEKQAKLKKLEEARERGFIEDDEYKRIWTEIEMGVKLPTPKKEDAVSQYMQSILGGASGVTPTAGTHTEQLAGLSSLYARKTRGIKPTETVSKVAGKRITDAPPFWQGRAAANVPRSELEYVEKPEPIYAVNPKTGERLISYDNGKTWEKVI